MRRIVFLGGPMHGAAWIQTKGEFAPRGEVWFGSERYLWAAPPIRMTYGELLILEYA